LYFLLRFLAFVGVFWLLRRLLGFSLGKIVRPAQSRPGADSPNAMVKDPVCGMYLDPGIAVRLAAKDGDLYFCSEECRSRYKPD
jgi:YHS domain-containing protein